MSERSHSLSKDEFNEIPREKIVSLYAFWQDGLEVLPIYVNDYTYERTIENLKLLEACVYNLLILQRHARLDANWHKCVALGNAFRAAGIRLTEESVCTKWHIADKKVITWKTKQENFEQLAKPIMWEYIRDEEESRLRRNI